MNLQYLAKVNRCSAQNLLESLQIPLPKGVKSLIIRRLKSHYDDADNLNMMGTIMLTKIMMIMSVLMMMSSVMLVFVDFGKCSAKSSAVEERDTII